MTCVRSMYWLRDLLLEDVLREAKARLNGGLLVELKVAQEEQARTLGRIDAEPEQGSGRAPRRGPLGGATLPVVKEVAHVRQEARD